MHALPSYAVAHHFQVFYYSASVAPKSTSPQQQENLSLSLSREKKVYIVVYICWPSSNFHSPTPFRCAPLLYNCGARVQRRRMSSSRLLKFSFQITSRWRVQPVKCSTNTARRGSPRILHIGT